MPWEEITEDDRRPLCVPRRRHFRWVKIVGGSLAFLGLLSFAVKKYRARRNAAAGEILLAGENDQTAHLLFVDAPEKAIKNEKSVTTV